MTQLQKQVQKLNIKRQFAIRLNAALDARGYPSHGRQNRLAAEMDLTQGAVRLWLVGDTLPSKDKQEALSDLLKVNLNWLTNGHGVMSGDDKITSGIPIIPLDLVNDWLSNPIETSEHCESIAMANPNSNLFAIKQIGDSMATSTIKTIPEGSLVVIDATEKTVKSGERYLVKLKRFKNPICREVVITDTGDIVFICSNPNEFKREAMNPSEDIILGAIKHVIIATC